MQTRLVYLDSDKNIELFKKNMSRKYGKLEELANQIQKDQCNNPEQVDDFMIWQTISSSEKDMEILDKLSDVTSIKKKITYREEKLFFTTDFYQILTPRRIELLDHIQSHNPSSLKTLAIDIHRDYKNVYDDAKALEKYGLLEFVREGKNKRPIARVTGIEVIFKR
jgi:predicted transcriptional regulator